MKTKLLITLFLTISFLTYSQEDTPYVPLLKDGSFWDVGYYPDVQSVSPAEPNMISRYTIHSKTIVFEGKTYFRIKRYPVHFTIKNFIPDDMFIIENEGELIEDIFMKYPDCC